MTETYIAEHLWLMTSAMYSFGGSKLETPRYTEMVYPGQIKKDTRTAEEIKQDILRKLVG